MNKKDFVKDYLHFTHKERIAIISLVVVIVFLIILPHLFPRASATRVVKVDTSWMAAANKVMQKKTDTTERYSRRSYRNYNNNDTKNDDNDNYSDDYGSGSSHSYASHYYAYQKTKSSSYNNSYDKVKSELFRFDPNTLDAAGWERLGLSSRTAETIMRYRGKGGKFYKKEDVQKIWGLPPGFYEKVVSYVDIAALPKREYPSGGYTRPAYIPYVRPEKKPPVNIEINSADTTAFATLPGIYPRFAARIIAFRNRLGGFYSIDQVKEVYGMDDSIFQKIKPYLQVNASLVHKINVNTATKDQLKVQLYIRWQLANAIVDYRNQHGKFATIDGLKKIQLITDEVIAKITPYLSL